MKYLGHFVGQIFIPIKEHRSSYNKFTDHCTNLSKNLSIEIKEAEYTSESQIGLFNAIVNMVADLTGNTFNDIVLSVYDLAPGIMNSVGHIQTLSAGEMSTRQLSKYIEMCIYKFNQDYNLNIDLEQMPNGKTKITNE